MIDDFCKREHHQSCIRSSCCSQLSKRLSPEVLLLKSVLAFWCKYFRPFRVAKKTRCSINKTRSLNLVVSSYGWSAFEIACAETLKGFQQRSPWKAPLHYFTSFMCCRHPPDSSRGRNARHLLNTFYTSRHQFAFVARAFACLLSSLEAALPTVSLRERWRERGDLTAFIMVCSRLTGKLWQLKATQARTRTHTHAHTCTNTHARTVWLHFFSLWICLVVVCLWRLYPHYSVLRFNNDLLFENKK